jgi:hypothetical protein
MGQSHADRLHPNKKAPSRKEDKRNGQEAGDRTNEECASRKDVAQESE